MKWGGRFLSSGMVLRFHPGGLAAALACCHDMPLFLGFLRECDVQGGRWSFSRPLHAHMRNGVAPIAVAGAAADAADLHHVDLAGREAVDGHGARTGEKAAALKRAGRATRVEQGVADFEALHVFQRLDAREELAAHAVFQAAEDGLGQRGACAIGAHRFEPAGKQRVELIAAGTLHIAGELAEDGDDNLPRGILGGSRRGASLRGVADGSLKGGQRRRKRRRRNGHGGVKGVAPQFIEDGEGGFLHGMIRGIRKTEQDAEMWHNGGFSMVGWVFVWTESGVLPCWEPFPGLGQDLLRPGNSLVCHG